MVPVFKAGSFVTDCLFDAELERKLQQAKHEHERTSVTVKTFGYVVVAHAGYVVYVQSNETNGTLAFGFTYDSGYAFRHENLN